jgi:predicted esterase
MPSGLILHLSAGETLEGETMKSLIAVIACAVLMTGFLGFARAQEKHLFYVHGCCIKDKNDPKVKAYENIVQELRNSGFNVVFELRTADMHDSDAQAMAYAAKIAEQVRDLLARGTAPEDITVAGYSLGSRITLVASVLIANPKVKFVLLAGCKIKETIPIDYSKVKGRVLSIRDTKDDKFGSCDGRLPEGVIHNEVVLNSGSGHAVFLLTDEKNLKLWKEPLINWTKDK